MKKILLLITSLLLISITAPSSVRRNESKIDSYKLIRTIQFEDEISDYVKDVGVVYKYSDRAKNFLNKEDLELIIRNCESYPSVIVAMAIIETGWGRYAIGNNYFGIKGKGHVRKTKEWDGDKFITITDSFQEYYSKEDNIKAVSRLLHNKRYNIGAASNYKEAAHLVKNGGYATDPMYAYKLKFIIEKYELYRLDEIKNSYKQFI